MKAIIEVDIPDYQIGQEVSIYFKDTMMIKGVVQEPSDDLISRQAVLDLLEDTNNGWIINEVSQLPSVNPQEPKTGHWIETDSDDAYWYMCSECHRRTDEKSDYCPNCGARMTEGSDTE